VQWKLGRFPTARRKLTARQLQQIWMDAYVKIRGATSANTTEPVVIQIIRMPVHESEIANPCGDECFVRCVGCGVSKEPVTDQKYDVNDQFPKR